MPSEDQKEHVNQPQLQPQQQQQQAGPPSNAKTTTKSNANSTISNELANMTQAFKDKRKLVRRAFSMPRNLFRLSRRVKNNANSANTVTKNATTSDTQTQTTATTTTEAATKTPNSCNQSVQTQPITDDPSEPSAEQRMDKCRTLPVSSSKSTEMSQQQHHLPEAKPQSEQDNKHRLFRRSTWKKFLFTRFIVQSLNLKVSTAYSFPLNTLAI